MLLAVALPLALCFGCKKDQAPDTKPAGTDSAYLMTSLRVDGKLVDTLVYNNAGLLQRLTVAPDSNYFYNRYDFYYTDAGVEYKALVYDKNGTLYATAFTSFSAPDSLHLRLNSATSNTGLIQYHGVPASSKPVFTGSADTTFYPADHQAEYSYSRYTYAANNIASLVSDFYQYTDRDGGSQYHVEEALTYDNHPNPAYTLWISNPSLQVLRNSTNFDGYSENNKATLQYKWYSKVFYTSLPQSTSGGTTNTVFTYQYDSRSGMPLQQLATVTDSLGLVTRSIMTYTYKAFPHKK